MKKIEAIIAAVRTMSWETRDYVPYFCAGLLYGLGMLDEELDEIKAALTETEVETE